MSWNAIFTTLAKMHFPRVYISWIHASIGSTSDKVIMFLPTFLF